MGIQKTLEEMEDERAHRYQSEGIQEPHSDSHIFTLPPPFPPYKDVFLGECEVFLHIL